MARYIDRVEQQLKLAKLGRSAAMVFPANFSRQICDQAIAEKYDNPSIRHKSNTVCAMTHKWGYDHQLIRGTQTEAATEFAARRKLMHGDAVPDDGYEEKAIEAPTPAKPAPRFQLRTRKSKRTPK